MNKKGFITIKILVFISILLMMFLLFSDHLKFRLNINDLKRNQKIQMESKMANYDTLLYKNYGLYAMLNAKDLGQYKSNASNDDDSIEIFETQNLSEAEVLEKQILDFMKIRMPSNYIEQLMVKLEMVIESGQTNKTLEILDQVYNVLKDFDNLLKEKVVLILSLNNFKPEDENLILESLEDRWGDYIIDYKAYDEAIALSDNQVYDLFEAYEIFRRWYLDQELVTEADKKVLEEKLMALSQAQSHNEKLRSDQLAYQSKGKNIINQLKQYRAKVNDLISLHKQLLEVIEALKLKERDLKFEIDDAFNEIKSSEAMVEVLEVVKGELISVNNMVKVNKITEDDYNRLSELVKNNKKILDKLVEILSNNYGDAFRKEELFTSHAYELLLSYNHTIEFIQGANDYQADPQSEMIYKAALEKTEEDYKAESDGRTINNNIPINNISGESSFWSVKGLKNQLHTMYEGLMINEYILGTLKAGALSSASEMDFFEKYQRPSFFNRGEVEYILYGKTSEKQNLSRALTSIYGIRVIMNGIHVYLDKEKLLLSESIGLGVAGWTGFLAPIVTQVVRLAWAMGESAYDIKLLLEGDSMPFLKLFPSEWHLDVGLKVSEIRKSPKLSHFTYHDYLRFFLMTMTTELKVKRFQNILILNFYDLGHAYDLSLFKTQLTSQGKIKYKGFNYNSKIILAY